jgi:hypothetical protein
VAWMGAERRGAVGERRFKTKVPATMKDHRDSR